MTREELIQIITDDITASCSLPFAPPKEEINRIITIEMKTLYREYRDLLEARYYVLSSTYYNTDEWKNTRTFQLPDCVEGIDALFEMTEGSRVFGINDPDMKFDRLMAADLYLTPLSTDQITYRTVQWSFWDLARAYNLRDIQFKFNINTKRLTIKGRDPVNSLFLFTLNKIEEETAFDDPIVIKWITMKCLLSLSRILGTFNYTLIGDVTISFDSWKSIATEELTKLEEKIKSDNACDWFTFFQ